MKQLLIRYVSDLDFSENLDKAKQEYTEGDYKSIVFHIYSGVLDEQLLVALSKRISDSFGTDMIAGTISAGEIKNGKLMDRGVLISVMMFETADVRMYRYENAGGKESEIGRAICTLTDNTDHAKGLELMLPGTNLHTRQLFEEISKCDRSVQVFGGYAGGHSMESSEHFV